MVAISFNNVWKNYKHGFKRLPALSGISFSVKNGEVFGFLGPNGAGKSTSIKLLLNFIRPDSGSIIINGLRVGIDKFRHLTGYLPETPCFYENLTGMELLSFAGKSSGINGALLNKKSLEILEKLNLEKAGNSLVRTYSKGMKQRLGLAIALIHDPEIYILDEPMSGLDPMGRRLITSIILDLRKKGKTVFFSSHILNDIERTCDEIGILNKGKLLYCGPVENMFENNTNMEDAFISLIKKDNITNNE